MKNLPFLFFGIAMFFSAYAQPTNEVKKLVEEGMQLQSKGLFDSAIKKYDAALLLNKDDFNAMYQKSVACLALKRTADCIELCKQMVQAYPFHPAIEQVYLNWANAVDGEGKWQEAIDVFDKGLAISPLFYTLYFNKGLLYMRNNKSADALNCYMAALRLNPLHSSSNYYLGLLLQQDNRMASLLALTLFIATEPQSERSKKAFDTIQEIVQRKVVKNDSNTIVVADTLNKERKENDFSAIDSTFSLLPALNKELDSTTRTEAEKFDVKLQRLIDALANNKKENKGFFWERYVPFLVELKEKGYTLVLSNLIFLSKNPRAQLWVNNHVEKVGEFYKWLEERLW